jgi:hypothetical protein
VKSYTVCVLPTEWPNVILFRAMIIDTNDGLPLVGTKRSMLGVRPTLARRTNPSQVFDVAAMSESDPVRPGTLDGLSMAVSIDRLLGKSSEPVWSIDAALLADHPLVLEFDPRDPGHVVIGPSHLMTLGDFQAALSLTRPLWQRV